MGSVTGHDVHIACAVDSAMLVPALAMFASVERHDRNATVHLLHQGLTTEDRRALATFVAGSRLTIIPYEAEVDVSDMAAGSDFPPAVLLRLELLDRIAAARCVYLDADTMVRASLRPLMTLPLEGHPLAATIDEPLVWGEYVWAAGVPIPVADYLSGVLGMASGRYINAGVMVVDLERWRTDGLTRKVMDFCRADPNLVFPDQDGLNAMLDGDVLALPCEWNAFACMEVHLWPEEQERPLVMPTIRRWRKAKIVHFAWTSKPWEPSHYPTRYDAEFWTLADRMFFGAILRAKFAARTGCARAGFPSRPLDASRRMRIAYGNAMRDALRGKRERKTELVTTLKARRLGEFLCTLARAFGGKGPWEIAHLYGAAIIRNSEQDATS